MSHIVNHIFKDLKANLKMANTSICDHAWRDDDYFFPFNSIGMVLQGSIYLRVGKYEYTIRQDEAYLLPAATKQSFRLFDCDKAVIHWSHFTSSIGSSNLFDLVKPPLVIKVDPGGNFESIFRQMILSHRSEVFGMPLRSNGLLYELIYKYYSCAGDSNIYVSNTYDSSAIYEILEYIDSHLKDKITIKRLAEVTGYNPNYFIEIFKKYFGTTPLRYVLRRKHEEAIRILIQTNLSIKEISMQLGFENQNHFSEFFKKYTGCSPAAYRSFHNPNKLIYKQSI